MKKFHEETVDHPSMNDTKILKRYYLDDDEVLIEQYNIIDEEEKLISTMKISKENAQEHIKSIIDNIH